MKIITKKAVKSLCTVLIACIIGIFVLLYLIFKHQAIGYVDHMNSSAISHYRSIIYFTNFREVLHIPPKGSYYIYGESSDYASYLAYANEFCNEDTLMYGTVKEPPNSYWAFEVVDGSITQLWVANYPLMESQLRPYSEDEQLGQISFLTKFNDSKAIGYYEVPEDA